MPGSWKDFDYAEWKKLNQGYDHETYNKCIEKFSELLGEHFSSLPEIDEAFKHKVRLEVKVAEEKQADNDPIEPMPIKLKPFQHQIRGYNMACMVLGLFED